MISAKGGVFKPTSFFTRKLTDHGSDGTGRRTPRRSGAGEKTPEPEKDKGNSPTTFPTLSKGEDAGTRKRQRQQPDNLPNALGKRAGGCEANRPPPSGEIVASSGSRRIPAVTAPPGGLHEGAEQRRRCQNQKKTKAAARQPSQRRAEEKTPEPEKDKGSSPTTFPTPWGNEQEAVRQRDRARSGEIVASPGTVL
ncbi:hypothetical protein NDU88_003689 [Pleurodeles waltl]|uniref:Uncharacterized protein n=1 Tax=Pleurodeles waltl TaxID=8319 RepID=A0AAV7PAA7_PLEWA|nr:hypothetical protein NDU88_003689 [Pleurodeles waltl]